MTNNPEEIKNWLKNRNKTDLRCTSNAKNRSICLVDLSNSDYITFDISVFRSKKILQSLYKKLTKISNASNDGKMLQGWINLVGRRK